MGLAFIEMQHRVLGNSVSCDTVLIGTRHETHSGYPGSGAAAAAFCGSQGQLLAPRAVVRHKRTSVEQCGHWQDAGAANAPPPPAHTRCHHSAFSLQGELGVRERSLRFGLYYYDPTCSTQPLKIAKNTNHSNSVWFIFVVYYAHRARRLIDWAAEFGPATFVKNGCK